MYALNIRVWMCTNTHCCVFLLICNEMTQYMNTNLPRKHDMKHISSGQQGHRKKQALLIQDSRQYFLYTEIIERGLTTSSTSRLYSHGSYSHRLGFWPQQPCTNKHYSSCRGRSLVKTCVAEWETSHYTDFSKGIYFACRNERYRLMLLTRWTVCT